MSSGDYVGYPPLHNYLQAHRTMTLSRYRWLIRVLLRFGQLREGT
jgi:hypothetical protein